jgi:hypothetical protein
MRFSVPTTRRLRLLLLPALVTAMATGFPSATRAADGKNPSALWHTYPLGPPQHSAPHRRVSPQQKAPPVEPVGSVQATPATDAAGPSGSSARLGWLLLAAGAAALTTAIALAAGVRAPPVPGGWRAALQRRAPARTRTLSDMSRTELVRLAAEHGVKGRSRMSRHRLIEILHDPRARGGPT